MSMDGYVGLFLVPDEGAQLAVINTPTVAVAEVVETPEYSRNSIAEITISNCDVASGMVKDLSIEYRKGALPAINKIWFGGTNKTTNVNDGDTITVNARVYTFKNTLSAVNQVKIGASVLETVVNFIKTINLTGVVGTNYYTGQTINTDVVALNAGIHVILRAITAGAAGNALTLSSTASTRAEVENSTFYDGAAAETTWKFAGTYTVSWTGNDNTAIFRINGMPTSASGIPYEFRVKWWNSDGQQAVDSGSSPVSVTTAAVYFNGISDITEYAEVTGLRVTNASNVEGDPAVPASLPPGGVARLEWDDMGVYPSLKNIPVAAPNATGPQTQTTANLSAAQISNIVEYVVYMYIATSATAPQCDWPRSAANEPNGTWYLVARTTNIYAEVQCPKNKKIGFWVGFGSKGTLIKTVTPQSQIAYAQY